MLQACPGRFVGANALLPLPFLSKVGRKIIEERFHLEAIQRPRHTPGHSEDVLQAEHAHTKGVKSRAAYLLAAWHPHSDELALQIFGGHLCKGHRQNARRRDPDSSRRATRLFSANDFPVPGPARTRM